MEYKKGDKVFFTDHKNRERVGKITSIQAHGTPGLLAILVYGTNGDDYSCTRKPEEVRPAADQEELK